MINQKTWLLMSSSPVTIMWRRLELWRFPYNPDANMDLLRERSLDPLTRMLSLIGTMCIQWWYPKYCGVWTRRLRGEFHYMKTLVICGCILNGGFVWQTSHVFSRLNLRFRSANKQVPRVLTSIIRNSWDIMTSWHGWSRCLRVYASKASIKWASWA